MSDACRKELDSGQESAIECGREDGGQTRPEPSFDPRSEPRVELRLEPVFETGLQIRAQRGRRLTSETRNQASFEAAPEKGVHMWSEAGLEVRVQASPEAGLETRFEARTHPWGDPPFPGLIALTCRLKERCTEGAVTGNESHAYHSTLLRRQGHATEGRDVTGVRFGCDVPNGSRSYKGRMPATCGTAVGLTFGGSMLPSESAPTIEV